MATFEQYEQEAKQKLDQQFYKQHAQFMHDAVDRGMALPCHTQTPTEHRSTTQKSLER